MENINTNKKIKENELIIKTLNIMMEMYKIKNDIMIYNYELIKKTCEHNFIVTFFGVNHDFYKCTRCNFKKCEYKDTPNEYRIRSIIYGCWT